MMIEFYFQYARDKHRAKLVIIQDKTEVVYYISKIYCEVPIYTKLADSSPQFIVCGTCMSITIKNDEVHIQ